jgi:hypothetical protein
MEGHRAVTWLIGSGAGGIVGSRLFCILDPRSGLLPKVVLVAGFSYLFVPIDLIPDRLPWIGHLDEAAFVLAGLVAGQWLALKAWNEVAPAPLPAFVNGRQVGRWSQRLLLLLARDGLVIGLAPFVLRLLLGRRATSQERQLFRDGVRANTHSLPPLMRGAAYIPAALPYLSRSVLLGLERAGGDTGPLLTGAQMMGDPLRIWTGPKIRFMHFEKTAGSSLITFLTGQFHPLQIDPDPNRNFPPHERTPFPPGAASAHRAACMVWGHYDLPSLRRLDGSDPCFRMALFREPSARILSLYYFWRANVEEQTPAVRAAHDNGLLDFLRTEDARIRNYIDNLYVRRLTGRYVQGAIDALRRDPQGSLELALREVDSLNYVGLSERLQDSLARLGWLLGFEPPAHTPRVNILARSERNPLLPYRPTPHEPITPAIEQELARLTALDRIVYEHAKRRFQAADDQMSRRPGQPSLLR